MNTLDFYRSQGVRLMNLIENETGKMMSEIDRELENNFWAAELSGNVKALKWHHHELGLLHDSLTMDGK